jgi:hypothetical protein
MNLKNNYISKFTDSFLKKQDKFQALKDLGNKKSIPHQVGKCKERLTEEYKFWMRKPDTALRTNKLSDIERDISVIRKLESQEKFSTLDIDRLNLIAGKYGL